MKNKGKVLENSKIAFEWKGLLKVTCEVSDWPENRNLIPSSSFFSWAQKMTKEQVFRKFNRRDMNFINNKLVKYCIN